MINLDKEYDRSKRRMILLNRDTAVLLNLFYMDDDDSFESIWYDEISKDYPPDFAVEAADEFVKQFRNHACPYFFKCLADRCNEEYQKWEKEHGEKYREILAKFEERRKELMNESNSIE